MKDEGTGLTLADALRAAVNVLRDSAESGRMPSGEALPPAAFAVHAEAADRLEAELRGLAIPVGKMPPPAFTLDTRSYLQGVRDAYANRPPRDDQADPLAYSSGRVEGEAARLQGRPLADLLERSRLPRLVPPAPGPKPC